MDERFNEKLKLEFLGELTLPDRLSAEELFRRMDSGELALPDEQPAPSGQVIPWAGALRRGLPIAACLALVVLLSQGGLWRMGSSGGAKLSGNAAAPQMEAAADTTAGENSDDGGIAQYNFGAEAPEEAPAPAPRAIAINGEADEEGAVEEEADEEISEDAVADAAPTDTARAENSDQKSAGTADGMPAAGGDLRPDSSPEIWEGDDADTVKAIWRPITEAVLQLSQQDEALTGLIPFSPLAQLQYDTYDDVTAYFPFGYRAYEIVTYRAIRCSIARGEDGEFHILEVISFEEWEPEED